MFAGMMKTESRPPQAPASTLPSAARDVAPPAITAEAFHTLVTASKQAVKDEVIAVKVQAKQDVQSRIKLMLQEHVDTQTWNTLLERARAVAAHGEKSFELIRFPCDLCSDGSRKIDVADADWPTTLRGEAAESIRGGSVNCERPGSGFQPKSWSTLTGSRATWRCP